MERFVGLAVRHDCRTRSGIRHELCRQCWVHVLVDSRNSGLIDGEDDTVVGFQLMPGGPDGTPEDQTNHFAGGKHLVLDDVCVRPFHNLVEDGRTLGVRRRCFHFVAVVPGNATWSEDCLEGAPVTGIHRMLERTKG